MRTYLSNFTFTPTATLMILYILIFTVYVSDRVVLIFYLHPSTYFFIVVFYYFPLILPVLAAAPDKLPILSNPYMLPSLLLSYMLTSIFTIIVASILHFYFYVTFLKTPPTFLYRIYSFPNMPISNITTSTILYILLYIL